MSMIRQDNNSTTGKNSTMLPWLMAAMFGLSCASLLSLQWHRTPAPATESLPAAVAAFDGGALASGTATFRTLADHGDPHAAYWYGHALDQGLGVPVDGKAAIMQFEKAWAGGVVPAGTQLGEIYLNGNVVPQDFTQARSFLREAAQRGDARAALDLGRMARDGIGAAADPVEAYAWLEIAALHGNAQARTERDHLLASLTPAQQTAADQQVTALQGAAKASDSGLHAKT
jgi:TPR repeat protein